jgi:hypothetical protein
MSRKKEDPRTQRVVVMVSKKELEAIRKTARSRVMTVSSWMRQVAMMKAYEEGAIMEMEE